MLENLEHLLGPEDGIKIRQSYEDFCRLHQGADDDSLWDDFLESLIAQNKCSLELVQQLREMVEIDFTIVRNGSESVPPEPVRPRSSTAEQAQSGNAEELPAISVPGHSLIKAIGSGAMGDVYLAKDKALKRRVALKRLKPRETVPQDVAERFLIEAQITAQLDHPNIIPVYGLESTGDQTLAYTMKLIKGQELDKIIADAREVYESGLKPGDDLSLPTRLEHFLKVCDALEFAHRRGVLHRDLKPANIMVGEFHEVYVMDWGIAKLHGDEALKTLQADRNAEQGLDENHKPHLTMKQSLAGTPLYMSPEQAKGKSELDAKSDIYTLGLILYELVCLKRARTGTHLINVLVQAVEGKMQPLCHISPKVRIPRELVGIIRKATQIDPEKRYASVSALSADIRRYLRGDEVRALPDNVFQRIARYVGKHRQSTLLLIFGLALLTTGSFAWSLYQQQQALLRHDRHQEQLTAFLAVVQQQGNNIENSLMFYEEHLRGIAGEATALLQYASGGKETFYHAEDLVGDKKPPDFQFSALYNQAVSTEWPAAFIPPTATRDTAERQLALIAPLRFALKNIFLKDAGNAEKDVDPAMARSLIAEQYSPLVWAYVGLDSGLAMVYPGRSEFPQGYDPRIRPWYQLAVGKRGIFWGNPHADVAGLGLLLPCSAALFANNGDFLGVLALELRLEYLFTLLNAGLSQDTRQYLVDEQGGIVVASYEKIDKYRQKGLSNTIELDRFPYPDQLHEITSSQKEFGQVELSTANGEQWFGFFKLKTLGWYYIVSMKDPEQAMGK